MPSDPPPHDPLRLIRWLAKPHRSRIALGAVFYVGAAVCAMTLLWMLGKTIDDGLIAGSVADFTRWLALMAALVVLQPILWTLGFRKFNIAQAMARARLLREVTDHLNEAGTGTRGRITNGEMVNLAAEDTDQSARVFGEIGFLLNNIGMFTVGAALVWSIHPLLGLVIILGSVATGLVAGPLLSRLQRRQSDYRAELGELTSQSADIVGGLRILRGIGGDAMFAARYREHSGRLRDTGYRVANSSSWIHALRYSMPILFVAAITWVGALLTANGAITFGGLASAFSFATMFIAVAGNFIGTANYIVLSWVGTKRVVRFLEVGRDILDHGDRPPSQGELHDPASGLTVTPGELTVLVTDTNAPALAALERLARHRDSDATWDGRPLSTYALAGVRERIMLLTDEDYLFAGTLARTLRTDGPAARAAIETACAGDVFTSLGSHLDAELAEGGRNLSGGQRQRLRLARAIAAEPATLLAVEPTSAVDAHTESIVAARVARARSTMTTVVITSSPMWAGHADRVVRMEEGKVVA